MNPKNPAASVGLAMELPARSNPQADLDWIFSVMPSLGCCPELAARGYSADEWHVDQLNLFNLADRYDISDADFENLVRRVRDRNRSIWREYSIFWIKL